MQNESGIVPFGFKVLVKIKKLEEKTKGGIIIPQDTLDREGEASQIATVIDYGQAAFTIGMGDLPKEWDIKPKVGDQIILERYCGVRIEGKDGEDYRLVNDKQILGQLV